MACPCFLNTHKLIFRTKSNSVLKFESSQVGWLRLLLLTTKAEMTPAHYLHSEMQILLWDPRLALSYLILQNTRTHVCTHTGTQTQMNKTTKCCLSASFLGMRFQVSLAKKRSIVTRLCMNYKATHCNCSVMKFQG